MQAVRLRPAEIVEDNPPMRLPASVDPQPSQCKICRQLAPLVGVVDFSKNCEERRGLRLSLSGCPVYYRRCAGCGFLFTEAFDDWSGADFGRHIYNDEYVAVDPDFRGERARGNAQLVINLFGRSAATLSVLDYGGGNGSFAESLKAAGFMVADTYDPFVPPHDRKPERKYHLVTCFETLEHTPAPMQVAMEISTFLGDEAMVIMSTLIQPAALEQVGLSWWYVAPRNGHVSMHSRASLTRMWTSVGLSVYSVSDGLHVAFRRLPEFAAPVIRIGPS